MDCKLYERRKCVCESERVMGVVAPKLDCNSQ